MWAAEDKPAYGRQALTKAYLFYRNTRQGGKTKKMPLSFTYFEFRNAFISLATLLRSLLS